MADAQPQDPFEAFIERELGDELEGLGKSPPTATPLSQQSLMFEFFMAARIPVSMVYEAQHRQQIIRVAPPIFIMPLQNVTLDEFVRQYHTMLRKQQINFTYEKQVRKAPTGDYYICKQVFAEDFSDSFAAKLRYVLNHLGKKYGIEES